MTIKQRIAEARGLCRDIETDLASVEVLREAKVRAAEILGPLSNTFYVLLEELREHVTEMLEHYEAQATKQEAKAARQ